MKTNASLQHGVLLSIDGESGVAVFLFANFSCLWREEKRWYMRSGVMQLQRDEQGRTFVIVFNFMKPGVFDVIFELNSK